MRTQVYAVLFYCLLTLAAQGRAAAGTWYVSGTGDDTHDGRSAASAFRTLQHAADLTRPGDRVLVRTGTYTNAKPGVAILTIVNSGTQDAWIHFEAYPGETPTISFNGWAGVQFGPTVSYVELRGFTITGNNAHVRLDGALRQGKVGDPIYSGNCVAVDGRKGTATARPHHLRIAENTISDCGGGGITAIQADYITIENNVVSDSAWYAIYGCSGISLLENWNSDDSAGYKMIVTGNRVYGNKELVPWIKAGKITDGEGIIVDTSRSPTLGNYKGRTLVANNVVYGNGSAAIEVFRSDHVDVVNNSTCGNVTNPPESGMGELNLNDVADVHVVNNIFSSAKGENPLQVIANKPCGCFLGWNVYYGGENHAAGLRGTQDRSGDPLYVDPAAQDRSRVDLRVRSGSPALHSGDARLAPRHDFAGVTRPQGGAVDRGAYQQN